MGLVEPAERVAMQPHCQPISARTQAPPPQKNTKIPRGAIAAPTVLKRGTRAKAQQTFQRWKLPGGINFEILTLISFD